MPWILPPKGCRNPGTAGDGHIEAPQFHRDCAPTPNFVPWIPAFAGTTEAKTRAPLDSLILSLSKEPSVKNGSGGMGGSTGSP